MSVSHKDRSQDEEIIGLIHSILNNGQMKVETVNEAILVALMKRRGDPIIYEVSYRDIEKDYECWVNEACH